ncbi:helicase RepA family protein [Ruminococcaceae bacterium OttesenSCG-928-L11]|nr:helicase RepA family protein [Ruminococcaceae bacterium OttesenSCG-928-L11]
MSKIKSLEIVDAETLYHEPQRKVPQFIEGLLPQGLNILCGASKIGKSWLMLWLCLQITKGESVWARESTQTDVLYLCLEDTYARIQERLHRLTDDPPEGLRFSLLCGRIGDGLEDEIESALAQHPSTKLIVIDTLQKVRRDVSSSVNAYSHDYSELSKLKTIADTHGICILLVHHIRKLADGRDPMNEVSGSTGITGTVDTIYVLKKDSRFSAMATLYVSGRDVEQQELSLKFENTVWRLVEYKGQAELHKESIPDFVYHVAVFMEGKSKWTGSMTQLLFEMSIDDLQPSAASRYLTRFCYEALTPVGIHYSTRRTGKERTLTLRKGDGGDANDA